MARKYHGKAYIWMMVSDDKYEFPLAIADTARQLAEMIGSTENNVRSDYCHYMQGRTKSCRYRRVELD